MRLKLKPLNNNHESKEGVIMTRGEAVKSTINALNVRPVQFLKEVKCLFGCNSSHFHVGDKKNGCRRLLCSRCRNYFSVNEVWEIVTQTRDGIIH